MLKRASLKVPVAMLLALRLVSPAPLPLNEPAIMVPLMLILPVCAVPGVVACNWTYPASCVVVAKVLLQDANWLLELRHRTASVSAVPKVLTASVLETVVAPFRLTLPVPVLKVPAPLCAKLPVCEKPVTPEITPAAVRSKLVESIASALLPPPMLIAPVEVPVLMLVAKFELALTLVVAPEIVAPAVPVIRPDALIDVAPEIAPVLVMPPFVLLMPPAETVKPVPNVALPATVKLPALLMTTTSLPFFCNCRMFPAAFVLFIYIDELAVVSVCALAGAN